MLNYSWWEYRVSLHEGGILHRLGITKKGGRNLCGWRRLLLVALFVTLQFFERVELHAPDHDGLRDYHVPSLQHGRTTDQAMHLPHHHGR